jgi:hypothetical protein
MKIYYNKDISSDKVHWTKPERWEVKDAEFLGKTIKVVYAYHKSGVLMIPEWCLVGESRKLLEQTGV